MLSVSVLIPTYNCQQYLAQAVQSAIHPEVLEIIVVDDGSTDDTANAVEALARSHFASAQTKLRYIQQPNQGVSAARNRGIKVAKGDLIAFLDADDWFEPEKLSKQVACFEANAELDIVQCGWQRVNASGELLAEVTPWLEVKELTLGNFLRFKPVLPSALMVRRQCLLEIDGFDTALEAAEDVDLMSRLLLKGYRAEWVTDVLVNYRQHGSNAMGNALTQARDINKFLDKFFAQADLPSYVQMLENSVRYYTLIWAACYLQSTGHFKEMAQQLRKAWRYSPHLPTEALICWIESFEAFGWQQEDSLNALLASEEWQQLVRWLLIQRS